MTRQLFWVGDDGVVVEKEHWMDEYQRSCNYYFDGRHYITVWQSADYKNSTLKAAKVNWAAIGSVDGDLATTFANCLLDAANLVDEWNKDMGRPRNEVLK